MQIPEQCLMDPEPCLSDATYVHLSVPTVFTSTAGALWDVGFLRRRLLVSQNVTIDSMRLQVRHSRPRTRHSAHASVCCVARADASLGATEPSPTRLGVARCDLNAVGSCRLSGTSARARTHPACRHHDVGLPCTPLALLPVHIMRIYIQHLLPTAPDCSRLPASRCTT